MSNPLKPHFTKSNTVIKLQCPTGVAYYDPRPQPSPKNGGTKAEWRALAEQQRPLLRFYEQELAAIRGLSPEPGQRQAILDIASERGKVTALEKALAEAQSSLEASRRVAQNLQLQLDIAEATLTNMRSLASLAPQPKGH